MKKTLNQLDFWNIPPAQSLLESLRKGVVPEQYRGDCTVYLLHFPLMGGENHAISHYIGSCKDLRKRLKQHKRGKNGAAITRALRERKLKFVLAAKWEGVSRDFEKYLKSWKNHKRFCPECADIPFFGDIPFFQGGTGL